MANEKYSKKVSGVRKRTHDGVDKVMDKVESMRDSGAEKLSHLKESATIMREDIDGYIKKNPEKSVLIAAGVGAVVGGILVAAMMRRKN